MSVASGIKATLAATGLTIAKNNYMGANTSYITFNYSTKPDKFAADDPQYEAYLIHIHLITPVTVNTTAYEAQIKALLVAAGYAYPTTVDASDDPAENHIVFETEIEVYVGG